VLGNNVYTISKELQGYHGTEIIQRYRGVVVVHSCSGTLVVQGFSSQEKSRDTVGTGEVQEYRSSTGV
jgi:hypothetical protein